MIRHWVYVGVMVPVDTNDPSPVKAQNDAWKKVERVIAGTDMTVSSAQWSRQEPKRSTP